MLIGRYVDYLRGQQGLSPYSIAVYSPFARGFVIAKRLPENAAALDASAVHRYLLDHGRDRSASFVKLLAAALRSFLRFCFVDGTTAADFSTAVLPVRRWQLAAIPPFLVAEKVEHVLAVAAAKRSTPRGCRAFAILLLLARLGLRASEVLTLELDDIRWDVGEIVVRGKGRLHDRLPLLEDVGEALALYCARPAVQASLAGYSCATLLRAWDCRSLLSWRRSHGKPSKMRAFCRAVASAGTFSGTASRRG